MGRDEEMELLLRRWAQAKAGSGRVVLISAEPGVGKSRLAEALTERIAGRTARPAALFLLAAPSGQRTLPGDRANGAGGRLSARGRAGGQTRQTASAAGRHGAADRGRGADRGAALVCRRAISHRRSISRRSARRRRRSRRCCAKLKVFRASSRY